MFRAGTPPLRLLLVEDSPQDEDLILTALERAGCDVSHLRVETEGGYQIALEASTWDIIVCDFKLPRFDPYRALELLRAAGLDVPLIVFSGVIQEDEAIELLKAGAADFITKDRMPRLVLAIKREVRDEQQRAQDRLEKEIAVEQMIAAWGEMLELRDVHTQGHTLRTTDLVLRLAREFDIAGEAFKNIYRGALLHDIGKMGVPDAVLLKEDVLTPEERRIIEMHPVRACQILETIPFLKGAMDIPCSHHEKWNGRGYPKGLMGSDIPFAARLFAVVDTFDALANDRPYRKSWDKPKVIEHLIDERNQSFDPSVVDRFVEMIGRG
jgi:putative two-component system response regulator